MALNPFQNGFPKNQPKVVRLNPYSIPQSAKEDVKRCLISTTSVLKGGCTIVDDLPFLVFRLHDSTKITSEHPMIVQWGWGGHFGYSATYSLISKKQGGYFSRVYIPSTSPVFPLLKKGEYIAALVKDPWKGIIQCTKVDFLSSPEALAGYQLPLSYGTASEVKFDDNEAHYWEVNRSLKDAFSKEFTNKDRLSVGWVTALSTIIQRAIFSLDKVKKTEKPLGHSQVTKASADILNLIYLTNCDLKALISAIDQLAQSDSGIIGDLFDDFSRLYHETNSPDIYQVLFYAILAHMISSRMTKCGKNFTWIDGPTAEIKSFEIAVDRFPPNFDPEDYWPRVPDEQKVDWGKMLDAADIHISPKELNYADGKFPIAEEANEVTASADTLLEEAVANKKWTIPPGAVIDLEIGPFRYIEVFETTEHVNFLCRNDRDEYTFYWVSPVSKRCTFSSFEVAAPNQPIVEPKDSERSIRIEAAMKLLFSAIIRDFWVMEERERAFATNTRRHKGPGGKDAGEPRVVYLPRIKYINQPDLKRCESELGQEERRAHFVRAHLRKTENPSDHQIGLAKRYGFSVPLGYTFVRPHERGKQMREVIYRSRSALHSLYTVMDNVHSDTASDWFKFERDVYKLMEHLKFHVEHISASKRNDRGVDVYASKGQDLDKVQWVIQCKCFRPDRKVGPNAVRDLIGALKNYPAGTKGMIVTTSDFSSGAVQEAEANGVRLMAGAEFYSMVSRANPTDI